MEMMRAKFGKTELETSPIVYGCMGGAGAFGEQDEKDSLEALREAYDVGINFFDTAEAYGDGYSEQLLNRALGDVRNNIVISSKVARQHLAPQEIKEACERSLKNLGTDFLDLYLLHWPSRDVPLADSMGALKELQQQGKIRYYGVSNFGRDDLSEAMELGELSTNQLVYNLMYRAIEFEVQPRCEKEGIPIMCYSSLMQGLLAAKYRNIADFPENRARTRMFDSRKWSQCRHGEEGTEEVGQRALDTIWSIVENSDLSMEELAVGWLKAQPAVGGVIVGTRNAKQSRGLAKLLEVKVDDSTLYALSEATDELKNALGTNIDMWGGGRTR